MTYKNLIELCKVILYLSNLKSSYIDLIVFNQFWVIPSFPNYFSKQHQGGKKALASSWKSYKRKHNQNSSQNKYQNSIISFPNYDLPKNDLDLSRVLELLKEKSSKHKLISPHKK